MRSAKRLATLAFSVAAGAGNGLWLAGASTVQCPASFGICFSEQRLANWQSAAIGLLTTVVLLSCLSIVASRFRQRA